MVRRGSARQRYPKDGKRARAAMYLAGCPIGFVLANGFMLILTSFIAFNSTTDAKNLRHPPSSSGVGVSRSCSPS